LRLVKACFKPILEVEFFVSGCLANDQLPSIHCLDTSSEYFSTFHYVCPDFATFSSMQTVAATQTKHRRGISTRPSAYFQANSSANSLDGHVSQFPPGHCGEILSFTLCDCLRLRGKDDDRESGMEHQAQKYRKSNAKGR
jgi:hypothetical protein